MMGTEDDPTDHKAVASSIFIAVAVYGVRILHCFLSSPFHATPEEERRDTHKKGPPWLTRFPLQAFILFCGSQAYLHVRASRRGAISL